MRAAAAAAAAVETAAWGGEGRERGGGGSRKVHFEKSFWQSALLLARCCCCLCCCCCCCCSNAVCPFDRTQTRDNNGWSTLKPYEKYGDVKTTRRQRVNMFSVGSICWYSIQDVFHHVHFFGNLISILYPRCFAYVKGSSFTYVQQSLLIIFFSLLIPLCCILSSAMQRLQAGHPSHRGRWRVWTCRPGWPLR